MSHKIKIWLRIIRIRFLLSSALGIVLGCSIGYVGINHINFFTLLLTLCGVTSLHISVDLFNDYWDFKHGIDIKTIKTKFSGGTNVLPSRLLKPSQVYMACIIFLTIGSIIGIYFIYFHGIIISIFLVFAIISVYFYSTKIVNIGISEIIVGIKGSIIVLGTYYIQNSIITLDTIIVSILFGILSSFVLFVTSIPDFDVDKEKGRKNLLIIFGKKNLLFIFSLYPILLYGIIIISSILTIIPYICITSLATAPLVIKSRKILKNNNSDIKQLNSVMSYTLTFSRLSCIILIISFIIKQQ